MRRPGYKKSEASQKQVLDAAVLQIAARGLAATSVQDVADAAGVSKGAVHYHFASKDDLLRHVLDRCCESLEQRVTAVFEEPGTPMERVRRAVYAMWAFRRDGAPEIRVLMELHAVARQNEAMKKALGAALERARTQIVEIGLNRLIEMGLRPKVPIGVVPRLILATLDGLALQHMVDPVSPEDEVALLRALEATALALFEL